MTPRRPFTHPRGRPAGPRRLAARACAGALLAALALLAGGCSGKGEENANLILGKQQIAASHAGQLAYVTNKAVAKPGPALVEMPNTSGVSHNIAIEEGAHAATPGGPVLGASPIVSKGTATVKVTLKPGSYTFFCEVPGHRDRKSVV